MVRLCRHEGWVVVMRTLWVSREELVFNALTVVLNAPIFSCTAECQVAYHLESRADRRETRMNGTVLDVPAFTSLHIPSHRMSAGL